MPSLNPGTASAGSTNVVIPAGTAPGSYFLIANADGDGSVPESNEGNNIRTKALTILAPDLTVTALSAPAVSGANRTISITDTTRNATGVSPAPASTTSYYLSTDSVWDGGDIALRQPRGPGSGGGIPELADDQPDAAGSVAGGNYFIIAKADGPLAVTESNEANNTRAMAIKIGPDLSVTALGAPAKSGAGLSVLVTDTTANAAGRSDMTNSTTSFYFSSDALLGGDTLLGSRSTGAIVSGGNSPGSATVTIPAGTTTGTWYIIAKADGPDGLFETSEANNTARQSDQDRPGPHRLGHRRAGLGAPRSDDQRHADDQEPGRRVERSQLDHEDLPAALERSGHIPGIPHRARAGAGYVVRGSRAGDDPSRNADGELQPLRGCRRWQRGGGDDRDQQHETEGHHDQLTARRLAPVYSKALGSASRNASSVGPAEGLAKAESAKSNESCATAR